MHGIGTRVRGTAAKVMVRLFLLPRLRKNIQTKNQHCLNIQFKRRAACIYNIIRNMLSYRPQRLPHRSENGADGTEKDGVFATLEKLYTTKTKNARLFYEKNAIFLFLRSETVQRRGCSRCKIRKKRLYCHIFLIMLLSPLFFYLRARRRKRYDFAGAFSQIILDKGGAVCYHSFVALRRDVRAV